MKVNENVERIVLQYLQKYLAETESAMIKELIENYSATPPISEAELRQIISDAVRNGFIVIHKMNDEIRYQATESFTGAVLPRSDNEPVIIVISKPRLRELGLVGVQLRNDQIDTIDCFRALIDSSTHIIRICSPFMHSDVVDHDAFPDLVRCISDALNRNVEIRILTRDLKRRGERHVTWIRELADDLGKEEYLSIVDYHLVSGSHTILSSTHAKLIISDDRSAYVGSAELRKNSLIANFEVGCLVRGSQVVGLCEIFDTMSKRGTVWQ